MRLGFTYDLRSDYRAAGYSEEDTAEFDEPATVNAIEASLNRLGFAVDRIGHVRRLAERLVAGERWDLVFNLAEGLHGRGREAQVPALLEAFRVPYVFSDPLTAAATLDKAVAKRLVRDAGLPTALFAVLRSDRDCDAAIAEIGFPAFVKPLAEGTGKGCGAASLIETPAALRASVCTLLTRFRQPVLMEAFLAGREFTVGIVGNGADARVIGIMELRCLHAADTEIYALETKEHWQGRVSYALADDDEAMRAGAFALDAYRALECRDAARLDFRSNGAGVPQFLEANPLPGLRPGYSDLPLLADLAGIPYDTLMGEILEAAMTRFGLEKRRRSRLDTTAPVCYTTALQGA